MANSFIHAKSSARKFGGQPSDYQTLHDWFDDSKSAWADSRHRALRHHSLGIFWAEEVFGKTIRNSDGDDVPVRLLGEQHVIEDCGFIPTVEDWLDQLPRKDWMVRGALPLSRIIKNLEETEKELAEAKEPITVEATV